MALSSFSFVNQDSFGTDLIHSGNSQFKLAGKNADLQHAVETIDTLARFEEIEDEWNDLFDRASKPKQVFQTFNWHWHWCRHFLKENDASLRIIGVWSGERLVMIWPLIIVRTMGVRQLKWMGAPVSQYGDILVDGRLGDSVLIEQVWSYILQNVKVDLIALEKVRGDSPIAALLKAHGAIITECQEAPYLDLASAENYDLYEKRYSGRSRKNRRRHRRRLGELGEIKFKVVETGEEAGALIQKTIDIKRDWLQAKNLVSRAYGDAAFDAFFNDVARSKNHPCGCMVAVISSAGKPIAMDVGFHTGDNFVAHIGAYDLEYERYSAGSLVTEDMLRDCFGRGISQFDFLAPNADYKKSWADGSVTVCDYDFPLDGRGYLYAKGINWFLRNSVKKILGSSPAFLRKIVRPIFSVAGF